MGAHKTHVKNAGGRDTLSNRSVQSSKPHCRNSLQPAEEGAGRTHTILSLEGGKVAYYAEQLAQPFGELGEGFQRRLAGRAVGDVRLEFLLLGEVQALLEKGFRSIRWRTGCHGEAPSVAAVSRRLTSSCNIF
jgi:hypothetical protein